MKSRPSASFFAACAFSLVAGLTAPTWAADHREAPLIREDPTADIADIYAFLSPNDLDRLVLVMTVNAFSAPPENLTYAFSRDVRYSFRIDNTGDAVEEHRVDVLFSDPALGPQTYEVFVDGDFLLGGAVTPPSVEPAPIDPIIATGPMGTLGFAGQRDDPFFFDSVAFVRLSSGTGFFSGTDGFAGYNVSAIVLDLPVASFLPEQGGSSELQIWGVTERRRVTLRRSDQGRLEMSEGPWQQIERMGNPAVNGLVARKDFFNIGLPENDASDFGPEIVGALMAIGASPESIDILTSIVVPDTLKLEVGTQSGFPNGRLPSDDVMDTLLLLIFDPLPLVDGVNANDVDLLSDFPFLAPPHQPE